MRTLRQHVTGADVGSWQKFLADAGFYEGELDGRFGSRTEQATRAFQRAHSLKADGVVGELTFDVALRNGLELAPDNTPRGDGPEKHASAINGAWSPPPPPSDANMIVASDPRVIVDHQPGALPCPKNPPPPAGWAYWKGRVSKELGQFAVEIEFAPARFPMGSFVQALIGTQLVAARVEWHDFQGSTGRRGCFRGTSLFRPLADN